MKRATALIGLGFTVFGFAAFITANGAPALNDSGTRVVSFYVANSAHAQASDTLWLFAFACLVFFASVLRSRLIAMGAEGTGTLALVGAAVMAVGASVYFGFDYAIANAASSGKVEPSAAQALNILALNLFFPVGLGGLIFGIATGLGLLKSGLLPKWLAVIAILFGLLTFSPLGLFGVLAFFVWVAVTSIWLWRNAPDDSAAIEAR